MKQIVIRGLTLIADRITDLPLDVEGQQLIDAINKVINEWDTSPAIVKVDLISFGIAEYGKDD